MSLGYGGSNLNGHCVAINEAVPRTLLYFAPKSPTLYIINYSME